MKIAVLGTGMAGRTIASRLAALGHDVTIGTRDPAMTMARAEPDGMGNAPYTDWAEANSVVRLATFAEAAAGAELVINATNGAASLEALESAGRNNLANKVLVDIANPLEFSQGMPPTLFVKDSDSLAEQIQRAFPDAKVVKTLNTMNAYLMADPKLVAGGDFTAFVSGNDAAAKRLVTRLLTELGHADVIDLGDITTARGAEMILPMWLRLWGALDTPMFNFKIVR
jgi:8-hydroxy-5-deazaflavin:NADPH oxidoreductase